jgi:iron only hydrogenase large subunit-like protein
MQSHTEVMSFLESNPAPSHSGHRTPVLSISPQSLASLAATVSTSSGQPLVPLADILTRLKVFAADILGFEHVYDTTFARHLSLLEHVREFEQRRSTAASSSTGQNTADTHSGGTQACCGKHTAGECGKHSGGSAENVGRLPMLASACPGWVCYAEKAHTEMLPFISQTKSPQAIMGTLVKTWFAQKWGKRLVYKHPDF